MDRPGRHGGSVIRKRHSGLRVQVDAGRDPLTGRKRWVSRQVPGQAKAAYRPAKKVEAGLLEQVDRGEQRGSRTRTVSELVERWFTWRQQVKPISPVTVDNDRGAIDRCILPALGRAKLREVDAAALDALYAQVRAHGGRCRACWTGIRRGEPPLRAGERDRPSVSASEGPSSLVAAPLATHKAGLGCAGLVRWAGDIERICGGSHTSTGNRMAGPMVDRLQPVVRSCSVLVEVLSPRPPGGRRAAAAFADRPLPAPCSCGP
jgi:hypothetical protein